MDLIVPCVKTYAWGSRHVIAELQGRESPSEGPEAELWMGAHPSGPSGCVRRGMRRGLDHIIADNPLGELGADVVAHFGDHLPFLLKVLAADQALSIQVHPDRTQAEAGFAAEEAAGIAIDDPQRNYRDDWPKPEVLVALTDFEALAGFREAHDAARMLRALRVDGLTPIVEELEQGGNDARTEALRHVFAIPAETSAAVVSAAAAAARRLARSVPDAEDAASYAAATRMAKEYPGDIGVIASLLLRHLTLRPGEGLFMAAGGPHAYLRGSGVEVMGNSDNVLRAGLTHKHIDVPEVLRIVDPNVEVPLLRPEADADGVRHYQAAVPEFALYSVEPAGHRVELPGKGPRIVLVTEGHLTLDGTDGEIVVQRGQAVFIPAESAPVFCREGGTGTAFVATPGLVATTPVTDHADMNARPALGGMAHRHGATRRQARRVGSR